MMKRLKSIIKHQAGLTLIELIIALAITVIVTGTVTMITFQVFDGEARSNNHMDAISRLQDAGREVSLDASMAQTVVRTNDEDGFPLTLTWTTWGTGAEDDELHQVVYSIEDNKLKREHTINGNPEESYIFEYIIGDDPDSGMLVTYCELDPDTTKITFILTATVGIGSQQANETRVYSVTPRASI